MMQRSNSKAAAPSSGSEVDFIGDHPAIDLINTVRRFGGELSDSLRSDADVEQWLKRANLPVAAAGSWRAGALLESARELRSLTLRGVDARKAGKRVSVSELNDFLTGGISHITLSPAGKSQLNLKRVYFGRTPREYLAPLAEAVADLFAHGDFNLVRRCEGESCVLWFYDRTKSHHRRFCSAAGCGNRAKVAAYRARQQAKIS